MIVSSVVPGVKTPLTPAALSRSKSASGMMPPPKTTMSPASRFLQRVDDRGEERVVRAAHDREADRVDVLLHRRRGDHLGRLVQAGVDDLEARVAQRPRDDLGAAVVPVEARLGDEDAELASSGRRGGGHREGKSVTREPGRARQRP